MYFKICQKCKTCLEWLYKIKIRELLGRGTPFRKAEINDIVPPPPPPDNYRLTKGSELKGDEHSCIVGYLTVNCWKKSATVFYKCHYLLSRPGKVEGRA